jgi:anti-sigma factor RsiW
MSIRCRQEIEVGAYLLEALEPAERARFTRHLSGCQVCRVEVEQLAPTAWRLLAFGESLRTTPAPSPTLRPRADRGQRPGGVEPRMRRDDDGLCQQRRGHSRRCRANGGA